jgi:hypothetical protein
MGTVLGNIIAFILIAIAASIGFVSFEASSITFTAIAYGAWALMFLGDLATKPRSDAPSLHVLSADEIKAYRTYHSYIRFPGGAECFSALLNALRVAGLIWGLLAILWKQSYFLGTADIIYFFVAGNTILNFNPVLYMGRAATQGNAVAHYELQSIHSVAAKLRDVLPTSAVNVPADACSIA